MTNPQNDPNYDPLAAAQKRPAVSFKNVPVNQIKRLQVESLSREAQQSNYDTGKPDFWPSDTPGVQGNPKMAVVFDVFDETAGEHRALWAPKPSSMLNALAAAQTEAGQRIAPGGVLEVFIASIKESTDPKKEGQKIYKAKYTPPAAGAGQPDALAPAAQPAAPAASDPWSTPATPAGDEPPF